MFVSPACVVRIKARYLHHDHEHDTTTLTIGPNREGALVAAAAKRRSLASALASTTVLVALAKGAKSRRNIHTLILGVVRVINPGFNGKRLFVPETLVLHTFTFPRLTK